MFVQFPVTSIREMKILKYLKHPNIVELKEIVSSSGMLPTLLMLFFKVTAYLKRVIFSVFHAVQLLLKKAKDRLYTLRSSTWSTICRVC